MSFRNSTLNQQNSLYYLDPYSQFVENTNTNANEQNTIPNNNYYNNTLEQPNDYINNYFCEQPTYNNTSQL